MNKEKFQQDFAQDGEYEIELPECSFKFVYQEAIQEDFAEQLVNSIKSKQEEK